MRVKKRLVRCEICGELNGRRNNEKRKMMSKFPLEEDRCKQWVKYVGKEDLVYVPIEKLHQLKHVCGDHFEKKAFNKKQNRLKRFAVPTKNLKANPLPDEMLLEFPCHIHSSIENTAESYVSQGFSDTEDSPPQVEPIDTVTVTYEYTRKKHTTDNIHMSDHSYTNSLTDMNLASGGVCNVNTLQAAMQELRREFGDCMSDIRRDIGELRSTMEGIMQRIGGLE